MHPGAANVARRRVELRAHFEQRLARRRPDRASSRLCSIDVLTRASMAVSMSEYLPSSSRRLRRACTSASALFLCSAIEALSEGPAPCRFRRDICRVRHSSAARACACRVPDARESASACSWVARSNSPNALRKFGRHRRKPGAAHRLAQLGDLLGVERAAFHRHGALLLEDGDAVFDDEIGGRRQRSHGSKRNDQPRHDADAAEREPTLQTYELTFEHVPTFLYLSAFMTRPSRSPEPGAPCQPRVSLGARFDQSARQCACLVHGFV